MLLGIFNFCLLESISDKVQIKLYQFSKRRHNREVISIKPIVHLIKVAVQSYVSFCSNTMRYF